jgi:CoA:oxalate CoA-transferase
MEAKPLLLKGVRILDLSTVLAGPYATMLLADLGAEVIKVENPQGGVFSGDFSRMGVQYNVGGIAAYFLAINRNKKSMGIDLSNEKGRKVFYDMVRISDVVFDNSKPSALVKMGADPETLKKINPDIICCSLSGFGKTGPDADMPAYDITIQARGGSMGITGEPGRPPVRMGLAMGDLAGSLFSALAITAALFNREKRGGGSQLDVALLDCQVSLLTYLSEYYLVGGLIPGPQGSGHETLVPYRAYKAKDYRFTIASFNDKHWQAVCKAMDREDLITDPRFNTAGARHANADLVNRTLEDIFVTKTVEEWGKRFTELQVPWGPINTIDRTLSDRQVLARNMVVDVKHPVSGSYQSVGNPIKISGVEEEFHPVPLMGEHTRPIMRDLLKYDEATIDRLFAEKVVGEQVPEDLETLLTTMTELQDMAKKQAAQSLENEKPS